MMIALLICFIFCLCWTIVYTISTNPVCKENTGTCLIISNDETFDNTESKIIFLVGTADGNVHAIDEDLNKLWTTSTGDPLASANIAEEVLESKQSFALPTLDGSILFYGNEGVRKSNLKVGSIVDKAPFFLNDELVLTASKSNSLIGVDLTNGKIIMDSNKPPQQSHEDILLKPKRPSIPFWIGKKEYSLKAMNRLNGKIQYQINHAELNPISYNQLTNPLLLSHHKLTPSSSSSASSSPSGSSSNYKTKSKPSQSHSLQDIHLISTPDGYVYLSDSLGNLLQDQGIPLFSPVMNAFLVNMTTNDAHVLSKLNVHHSIHDIQLFTKLKFRTNINKPQAKISQELIQPADPSKLVLVQSNHPGEMVKDLYAIELLHGSDEEEEFEGRLALPSSSSSSSETHQQSLQSQHALISSENKHNHILSSNQSIQSSEEELDIPIYHEHPLQAQQKLKQRRAIQSKSTIGHRHSRQLLKQYQGLFSDTSKLTTKTTKTTTSIKQFHDEDGSELLSMIDEQSHEPHEPHEPSSLVISSANNPQKRKTILGIHRLSKSFHVDDNNINNNENTFLIHSLEAAYLRSVGHTSFESLLSEQSHHSTTSSSSSSSTNSMSTSEEMTILHITRTYLRYLWIYLRLSLLVILILIVFSLLFSIFLPKSYHIGREYVLQFVHTLVWLYSLEIPSSDKEKHLETTRESMDTSISRDQEIKDNNTIVEPIQQSAKMAIQEIDSQGRRLLKIGQLCIQLDNVIGYGSNGTMIFAGDFSGRPIAVKRMLSQFQQAAEREISLLIESDEHPNVVRYYLKEEHQDFVYLGLQLCSTSLKNLVVNLSEKMKQTNNTTNNNNINESENVREIPEEAKQSLLQIVKGLSYLHAQRIVHRDIKPHNILCALPLNPLEKAKTSHLSEETLQILGKYILKISDMGLSKQLSLHETSLSKISHTLLPSQTNPLTSSTTPSNISTDTTSSDGQQQGYEPVGTIGWQAPELLFPIPMNIPSLEPPTGTTSTGNILDSSSISTITTTPYQTMNSLKLKYSFSADIFSLGCVYYYVLTLGDHPFGPWYERIDNISKNKFNLDKLIHFPLIQHLLTQMLQMNPMLRPTSQQIQQHPFFWENKQKLDFLLELSDRLENEQILTSSLLLDLESKALSIFLPKASQWDVLLPSELVQNSEKYRKYDVTSLRDLLRLIRNKRHHFNELSKELQTTMGSIPNGFYQYFETIFPKLFLICYTIAAPYLLQETAFIPFYQYYLLSPVPMTMKNKPLTQENVLEKSFTGEDEEDYGNNNITNDNIGSEGDVNTLNNNSFTYESTKSFTNTSSSPMITQDLSGIVIWNKSNIQTSLKCNGWLKPKHDWKSHNVPLKGPKIPVHVTKALADIAEGSLKFRSRLCNHWECNGGSHCDMKKKNKCTFAHGYVELRVRTSDDWENILDLPLNASVGSMPSNSSSSKSNYMSTNSAKGGGYDSYGYPVQSNYNTYYSGQEYHPPQASHAPSLQTPVYPTYNIHPTNMHPNNIHPNNIHPNNPQYYYNYPDYTTSYPPQYPSGRYS